MDISKIPYTHLYFLIRAILSIEPVRPPGFKFWLCHFLFIEPLRVDCSVPQSPHLQSGGKSRTHHTELMCWWSACIVQACFLARGQCYKMLAITGFTTNLKNKHLQVWKTEATLLVHYFISLYFCISFRIQSYQPKHASRRNSPQWSIRLWSIRCSKCLHMYISSHHNPDQDRQHSQHPQKLLHAPGR